ncbi:protein of unknown function [Serratia sp. Tan611]|nr:protein of unknown function [Serratia sp. Tan611]
MVFCGHLSDLCHKISVRYALSTERARVRLTDSTKRLDRNNNNARSYSPARNAITASQ